MQFENLFRLRGALVIFSLCAAACEGPKPLNADGAKEELVGYPNHQQLVSMSRGRIKVIEILGESTFDREVASPRGDEIITCGRGRRMSDGVERFYISTREAVYILKTSREAKWIEYCEDGFNIYD